MGKQIAKNTRYEILFYFAFVLGIKLYLNGATFQDTCTFIEVFLYLWHEQCNLYTISLGKANFPLENFLVKKIDL